MGDTVTGLRPVTSDFRLVRTDFVRILTLQEKMAERSQMAELGVVPNWCFGW